MLKEHLDLRIVEHALLHDLRGAQIGFAHNHIDFLAEPRQVVGFLAGRVTTADDSDRFLAIEETIAGSAGTHAAAFIRPLTLDAEIFRTCAGRNDYCVCFVEVCVFDPDLVGFAGFARV